MSLGYCGKAILEMADENELWFLYYSYNLNLENYKEHIGKYDGEIIIKRSAFVEPDIYMKRIRRPSGRIKFEKRIRKKEVNIQKLIENGDVKIVNSSGTWNFIEGNDVMAICLARQIFVKYQEERDIPEMVNIYQ